MEPTCRVGGSVSHPSFPWATVPTRPGKKEKKQREEVKGKRQKKNREKRKKRTGGEKTREKMEKKKHWQLRRGVVSNSAQSCSNQHIGTDEFCNTPANASAQTPRSTSTFKIHRHIHSHSLAFTRVHIRTHIHTHSHSLAFTCPECMASAKTPREAVLCNPPFLCFCAQNGLRYKPQSCHPPHPISGSVSTKASPITFNPLRLGWAATCA